LVLFASRLRAVDQHPLGPPDRFTKARCLRLVRPAHRDADADLPDSPDTGSMQRFRDIASVAADDGIVPDPASVRRSYPKGCGTRAVTLNGKLANARCVAR
jgi:hypothetical protein